MGCTYTFQPLKQADEAAEAAARAFARASIYERVWLHAVLETSLLRARAEPLAAFHGERLVGLRLDRRPVPFRMVALDGSLPGVAVAPGRLEPFVCMVPRGCARDRPRGGRFVRRERRRALRRWRSVRQWIPDRGVCRSARLAVLRPSFAPLELELAPFFGVRDRSASSPPSPADAFDGRVALLGHLEDATTTAAWASPGRWPAYALETRRQRVARGRGASSRRSTADSPGFRSAHDAIFAR
jgi:hypothetical protein